MMKRYGVGVLGLVVAVACGSESVATPADGGGTDSGPDAITPCDPQKDVACISEEKGFFVKTGSQGGDGTRAKPFGKVQEGIEAATATKFRVYVCEGDYAETVNIKKTVGLYGGLTVCDASTWTPTVGRVSKVKAAAGYALDASGGSIEITDLSFTAPDFAGQTETTEGTAGKSSIAAFIHSGADVQAKRTSFTAQGGGNAKPTMADPSGTGAPGTTGGTADGTNVGAGGLSTCGVAGGKGGTGGSSNPVKQSSHGAPVPANETVTSGRRGCNANVLTMTGPDKCSGGSGSACGAGEPGTGGVGRSSTPSASLLELSGGGAAPKAGAAGEAGGAGGGAGGGGGGVADGQNGGGGGAGGCGGSGGKGGGAGGASIAVVVHDARFACSEGCKASAGVAGSGGKGQKGQQGGMGGDRGTGECAGGRGGGGAGGQGGQGGAGGLAAGLSFGGSASLTWAGQPVADSTATLKDVAAGTPGKPGEAGDPGEPGPSPGTAGSVGAPSAPGPSEATASAAKKL